MADTNQRRFKRTDSFNFLDYVVLDKSGEPIQNGMGRTLNVSENGLLLETNNYLSQGQDLMMTLGLHENTVELKGQVAHSDTPKENLYCSGVAFKKVDRRTKKTLKKFLQARKKGRSK